MFSPIKPPQKKKKKEKSATEEEDDVTQGALETSSQSSRRKKKKNKRLEEIKNHNSFDFQIATHQNNTPEKISSPFKSPDKQSTEEPRTPKIVSRNAIVCSKPISKISSLEEVDEEDEEDDDDYDDEKSDHLLFPSPVSCRTHRRRAKKKEMPQATYQFSCDSKVKRSVPIEGSAEYRRHDRRKLKQQEEEANCKEKCVKYNAEFPRPLEEFIYPSLRPSAEELEKSKREFDLRKNRDFSLDESQTWHGDDFHLHWKIVEGEDFLPKREEESALLSRIDRKGEQSLRSRFAMKYARKVLFESKQSSQDLQQEDNASPVHGRKQNMLGRLFGKTDDKSSNLLIKNSSDDFEDPHDVYYRLVSRNKRSHNKMRRELSKIKSVSALERSYEDSKEKLLSAVEGFDESNDHFHGLLYYQVKNTMSEQQMNKLLNSGPTVSSSPDKSVSSNKSSSHLSMLPTSATQQNLNSPTGITSRQQRFQLLRASSSLCKDDGEERRLFDESTRLKAGRESYSGTLSHAKRATRSLYANFNSWADLQSSSLQSSLSRAGGKEQLLESAEERKRLAQDALLWNEIKAGLIPERLLKKVPRMGALVSLDLSYFGLGDELCSCLGNSLSELDTLHTLGLRANRLTFRSINTVLTNVNLRGFRHLDISMNQVSGSSVSTLCDLLEQVPCRISSLELERTGLTQHAVNRLCTSIMHLDTSWLMELSLARNALGRSAMDSIASVLKYPGCSLSWLDLSWNSFDSSSGACLADALSRNKSLTSVDLSSNSLRDSGGQRIAACLLANKTLQEIYLSLNGIGGKSCFIFSKVLRGHPSMTRLNLSDNPLTEAGARSIFRTILRGLRCFVMMQNCTFANETGLFNHSNPSLDSPYTLDLSEPYQVAVLSELISMVNLNKNCRFSHITYKQSGKEGSAVDISAEMIDGETYLLCNSAPWSVPSSGVLRLSLMHRPAVPTLDMAIDDLAYNTILAIVVNARTESDRKNWLFLMCMDAFFTTEQAQDLIDILSDHNLLGCGGISMVEFFNSLWSNIIDTVNLYEFFHRNLDEHMRLSLIHTLSFEKFRFNWINPTGHWRLDLSNKVQRSVMMQLVALNSVEKKRSRRAKRGDTSQKGNWCNFRNERLMGEEVEVNADYVKSLPWLGVLEFDYVTTSRPALDSEVISDDEFRELLCMLDISPRRRLDSSKSSMKILELQLAATKHYFSPSRILTLMSCFAEEDSIQTRVIVCLFGRLLDLHNFDVILRHVSAAVVQEVLHRLGVLNCLNPLKPSVNLKLNMKYMDNRILTHAWLQMSSAEGGDQLKQHPRSEVDIIALYAALGRLIADPMEGTLMFAYCEVGERDYPFDWRLRKENIHHFLIGTQPRDPNMTQIIAWYKEMKAAGGLQLGPIDIQYKSFQHQQSQKKLLRSIKSTVGGLAGMSRASSKTMQ